MSRTPDTGSNRNRVINFRVTQNEHDTIMKMKDPKETISQFMRRLIKNQQ